MTAPVSDSVLLVPAATTAPKPKPAEPVQSRLEADAYSRELQVLQPAQRAVARGDFVSAFGPIGEHQREFPSGVLAEERDALRVKALLGLGRVTEARHAASSFRRRFPKSALNQRMDALLEAEK